MERRVKQLIKQNNFNIDTNGLHIVTYNCTNFTTDGDKFEFIKTYLHSTSAVTDTEMCL